MIRTDNRPNDVFELRKHAEEIALGKAALSPGNLKDLSLEEIQQMLHELQVHQIELEIQNEELKQTQLELEASRDLYFNFYDLSPVGYCSINENGLILESNLTTATLLGMARNSLVKQPITRYILKEDQDIYYLHCKQLLETSEPHTCELRMVKFDGTVFWALLTDTASRDASGKSVFHVVITDIMKRKQAEDVMLKSDALFTSILKTAMDGFFITDINGRIIESNDSYCKMSGYSREELLAMSFSELEDVETPAYTASHMYIVMEQGKDHFESRHRRKDGRVIDVDISVHYLPKPEELTVAFVRDITGRKRAEDALRKSEIHLQTLVQTIPDLIWLKDRNGVYLDCNPTFERFFGASKKDIVGKTDYDFVDRELADFFREQDRKAIAVGKPSSNEEWVTFADDGYRALLDTIKTPMFNADGMLSGVLGIARDVTDRKRTEEALLESERKHRELIELSPVGIFKSSSTGQLLFANPEMARIMGADSSQEAVDKFQDLAKDFYVDPNRRNEFIEALKDKGAVDDFEHEVKGLNGKRLWLTMGARASEKFSDGRFVIDGFITDITERKRTEEALRASEEKYRLIAENTADIISIMDMNLHVTYVSPAIMHQRGFTVEEAMAQTLEQVLTPESKQLALAAFEEEMLLEASGKADPDRKRILELEEFRKDGSTFWLEVSLSFLRDKDCNPIEILTVSRDITNRKRVAEALLENRRQLADIIEFLPDATLAIDNEKRVIIWNKEIEKMTGIPASEMIGKSGYAYAIPFYGEARPFLMDMIFMEDKDVMAQYSNLIREGDSHVAEVFCNALYNNKGSWVSLKASPLHDEAGNIIGAIESIRDITERKLAEKERENLQSQLFQAQKMEAIGTLAGGIAHDFNNILSGIMGYIELVKTRFAGPDNIVQSYLEGALQGIKRASLLVSQMMTFSRQQEAKLQPLEMGPLLKEAIKLLRSSIPAMVKINYHIATSNDIILANPTQIHQIIMNLCINAAHSMKDKGGSLDIALNHISKGDDVYNRYNELNTDAEYQELVVRDTGYGIDHQDIDRIFEPFFTTKKRGEGTGLGLAVVYGIVKSLDGVIKVESRPRHGTTFRVFIPTVAITIRNESDDQNSVPGGSERIMIVDDEQVLTQIFKAQLENIGYKVTTYNDPLEAVEVFKNHPADFDLIITDLAMPNKKGTELFVEVKQIMPDIPIILCTGTVEVEEIESFSHIGIQNVVAKPVSIHRLSTVIRQVLDNSR